MLTLLDSKKLQCKHCKSEYLLSLKKSAEFYCSDCGRVSYYHYLREGVTVYRIDTKKSKSYHSNNIKRRKAKYFYNQYKDINPNTKLSLREFIKLNYPYLAKQLSWH